MRQTILVVISTCSLMACTASPDGGQQPVAVESIHAEALGQQQERHYSFISQPFRSVELSFRVGEPVCTLDVQNGQFFRKGDLIAAIDARDFLICKQRAEAVFRQAEADYKRVSNLYAKGNVSGVNYEKARADYGKAKADYETAVNNLKDTRLYAPFDGYVQKVCIERYQDVLPSTCVVTFIDLSRIKVEAYLPEGMAMSYCANREFVGRVAFDALPDTTFVPVDTYVTQSITENSISYLFTVILDNRDNSLLGGMAGSLNILCQTSSSTLPGSVAVPQKAVCHTAAEGTFVWRVDGKNRVYKVPVKLGELQDADRVEVLSGLSVGERIAVSCLSELSEGETVSVQD